FPVRSPSFLAWTAIKFLLSLGIAAVIANDIALRFLTIQNYMTQTNSSWAAQIGNYFGILGMRLAGTYQVSPTFGIDNVFTFEVFRLILSLLGLAFIVLGIRFGISIIPNFLVGITKKALGMSRKALLDHPQLPSRHYKEGPRNVPQGPQQPLHNHTHATRLLTPDQRHLGLRRRNIIHPLEPTDLHSRLCLSRRNN